MNWLSSLVRVGSRPRQPALRERPRWRPRLEALEDRTLLNNRFVVPAIHVATSARTVEVRIRLEARLAGEYWAATNGQPMQLAISGEPDTTLAGEQASYVFTNTPTERTVTMTATVSPQKPLVAAFVRRDRLVPDRGYLPPPQQSPFR